MDRANRRRDPCRGNTETLSDFPVPLFLGSQFDHSAAVDDGGDLRLTNAQGTSPLAFEIESFEPGSAVVWVRIPNLPPTGTFVLLYYGNPSAPQANSPSVWDDDFVGVWHMGDAGNQNVDSSIHANHADFVGSVSADVGKVGAATRFSGTSFSNAGSSESLELTSTGTISAWVLFDAISTFAAPLGKAQFGDAANISYGFQRNGEVGSNGEMGLTLSSGGGELEALTSDPVNAIETWFHFTGRWDGTSAVMFDDGARSGAAIVQSITPQVNGAHPTMIGCSYSPGCTSDAGVEGLVDEVRVSRIARTDEWIATSVRGMRNQLVFFGETSSR